MKGVISSALSILILAATPAGAPAGGGPPEDLPLQEELVLGQDENALLGDISDAAVDAQGNIYLLDRGFKTVHKFSPDGEFLLDLGREGEAPGEFYNPLCLAAGPDGRIYVAGNSSFITVLEPDGTPAESIKRKRSGMARSLCFGAGGSLYVSSFDRAERTMVHKYSAGDFVYERSFGAPYGEGRDIDPQIEGVYAVGFLSPAPEGGVYYCQMVPQLVRVFDGEGNLKATHAVRSGQCPIPEPEITDSGMKFTAFTGASALESLPGGSYLTVLWVSDGEDGGETLIDVYDGEGTLTHTRSEQKTFRVKAADSRARIYVYEERDDAPVVVRYRVDAAGDGEPGKP